MTLRKLSTAGLALLVATWPGRSQTPCTPSITGPQNSAGICPSTTRSTEYAGTYPDTYSQTGAVNGLAACTLVQTCNNGVLSSGYIEECPWSTRAQALDGSFKIFWKNALANRSTDTCGSQQYVSDVTCALGNELEATYSHYCQGCQWHNPDCGSCYTCTNNTCQSQLRGLSCQPSMHPQCYNGVPTCCANCNNGEGGCRTTCGWPCGMLCLDCYKCPNNLNLQGCSYNNPVCSTTPVVLDPFDQGFHLTSLLEGVEFREAPNGPMRQMSWTDPRSGNGWLALDRDRNGAIDNLSELFGDLTPQPQSDGRNGFLALAVFDDPANGGNGNGVIDPGDAVYSHLRVWIDANHNGVSEQGELHGLPELGIFKIGLRYHPARFVDQYGNRFRYRGAVWDEAGHGREVCYDVLIQVLMDPGED